MWLTVVFCLFAHGWGCGVCIQGVYRQKLEPTRETPQIITVRLFLSSLHMCCNSLRGQLVILGNTLISFLANKLCYGVTAQEHSAMFLSCRLRRPIETDKLLFESIQLSSQNGWRPTFYIRYTHEIHTYIESMLPKMSNYSFKVSLKSPLSQGRQLESLQKFRRPFAVSP